MAASQANIDASAQALAASLPSGAADLYDDPISLRHHQVLAQAMAKSFKDPELTTAAFLLGLAADRVQGLAEGKPRARALLEDCRAIRELPRQEPSATTAPVYSGSLEAVLLCVWDLLIRHDPARRLPSWTRKFHRAPTSTLPQLLPAAPEDRPQLLQARGSLVPLARSRGFWAEANVLDDLALLLLEPARAEDLLTFAIDSGRSHHGCLRQLDEVRALLAHAGWSKPVQWEWRHLGSLDRHLAGFQPAQWSRALFRCGFVTVTCRDEDDCYRTLGHLHRRAQHRPAGLRDHVGTPSPAHYKAIHTVLEVQDPDLGTLSIAVRILPQDQDSRRFGLVGRTRLARLSGSQLVGAEPRIRVYTPTGEQLRLPPGATVLDLAHAIHRDFVALAEHAILNRSEQVDLLHALADGDEVRVVTGTLPRPLPAGWDTRVPPASVERLTTAYRRTWRAVLVREGLRLLKRRLLHPEADDRLIRALTDLAITDLGRERREALPRGTESWLERVGAVLGPITPPEGLVELGCSPRVVHQLADTIERKAGHLLKVYAGTEVEAPEGLRGQVQNVVWCPVCAPGEQETELAVTTARRRKGAVLVIHRQDAPCAEGGMPLRLGDHLSLDQFFVVETNNEVGVALQILDVFRVERVDVVEVVGRRLGPRWGLFRVEVDAVEQDAVENIRDRLLALENVYSVRTPLDEGPAVLEVALPPRQAAHRGAFFRPAPYVAGPIAVEDHLFYGREAELEALFALLQQVGTPQATAGAMTFVNGPLRMGKTSLVRRFELLLRRQPELKSLPLYVKADTGQRWRAFRTSLRRALAEALPETLRLWGQDDTCCPPRGSLEERINAFLRLPSRPTLVLIVDEVHRLFGNVGGNALDRRGLAAFRNFVERTPRLLVLWTGPSHGARSLHREVADLIGSIRHVPVLPFTEAEALDLLEARKMTLFQPITVERALARHLHRVTGGEPFWLAHLANLMWMRSARSGGTALRFDRALADTARRDLLDRHELFSTRIEPRRPDRFRSAAWRVALTLVQDDPDSPSRRRRRLTAAEIAQHLRDAGHPLTEHDVARALDTLHDRGAVRLASTRPRRWRIAFPLLADYLVLHGRKSDPRPPCSD